MSILSNFIKILKISVSAEHITRSSGSLEEGASDLKFTDEIN